ncbi:MAG: Uma2 family endonuclease [Limnochordales bacterium]|nr:Uma2 family endonuclease [Limnochordales bacterium]
MALATNEIACSGEKVYTYEEYRQLPEGSPYQLIGGRLVMTPSPTPRHQFVSFELELQIATYIREKQMGVVAHAPLDVYFEATEVFQPDIVFISRERLNIIGPDKINGAPDLIVEILSPATAYYDLKKKFRVYEKHGVREYWIVDPEDNSIQIYVLRDGKLKLHQEASGEGQIQSKVLEGFSLDIKSIFDQPVAKLSKADR